MAAGDLITADWQAEYRDLLLGDGTAYVLTEVTGVADQPNVRTADTAALWRHGATAGQGYLDARTIGLSLEMTGDTDAELATNYSALTAALDATATAVPLVLQLPGVADGNRVQASCLVRKRSAAIDLEWKYRLPIIVAELYAPDPLLYGTTLNSEALTVPTAEGGLTFPVTMDALFGTVSTGGTVTASNAGTTPTWPTVTFTGPGTGPRLENLATGQTIELDTTLTTGQAITIDMQARTITEGTANRYSWLATDSEWWQLQPGDQTISFHTSSGASASCTVTWRDAWL